MIIRFDFLKENCFFFFILLGDGKRMGAENGLCPQ